MSDELPVPPCHSCGGEVRVLRGQRLIVAAQISVDEDGIVTKRITAAWCGACVADWDYRLLR